MSTEIKVYRLNEYDWVAATSLGEALEWYQRTTGISDEELIDSNYLPEEVSEEALERLTFRDDEGEFVEPGGATKFARVLEAEKAKRKDNTQPFLFASTEF